MSIGFIERDLMSTMVDRQTDNSLITKSEITDIPGQSWENKQKKKE